MKKLIFTLILILGTIANAETTVSITAGPLFGLGSLRIGAEDWEAGILGPGWMGIYSISRNGDFYLGIGPGVAPNNVTGYGIRGALGIERDLWQAIYVKLEASSCGATNGTTSGDLQAGLTIKLK